MKSTNTTTTIGNKTNKIDKGKTYPFHINKDNRNPDLDSIVDTIKLYPQSVEQDNPDITRITFWGQFQDKQTIPQKNTTRDRLDIQVTSFYWETSTQMKINGNIIDNNKIVGTYQGVFDLYTKDGLLHTIYNK